MFDISLLSALGESVIESERSTHTPLILIVILLVLAMTLVITFLRSFRRCPSNKVLVIYGKTGSGASRTIHGGAAIVWPLIQACEYLDLEPFVVPIDLKNALSQENIRVSVPTTVTAAISYKPELMQNAAVRLLCMNRIGIQRQAEDIILGQMRAVIATMKIQEINSDRQAFLYKVNEAVSVELEKIGLEVINVNIKDITDESGYIEAIGRKAASQAINQAAIDVSEQERLGNIGVAERQRDMRKAVASANAEAEIGEAQADRERRTKIATASAEAQIGEASADRDRRQQIATLDAQAVNNETEANAKKASYNANQKVAEQEARQRAEVVAKQADGQIRVADQLAQRDAEEARAKREESRLKAEQVVPADIARTKLVIESEAQKQQRTIVAEGDALALLTKMRAEAEGTLVKMKAEAAGTQAILDAKAEGYRKLIEGAAADPQTAASLLVIEKLTEVAHIQAQAVSKLPLEKIIVWDGGGNGEGLKGLGGRMLGALPPMHQIAGMVGLDLPEYLGKVQKHEEPKPTQIEPKK